MKRAVQVLAAPDLEDLARNWLLVLLAALLCFCSLTVAADDGGCLTTPNGIPLKVIIKQEEARAFANEDFSGERQPLKFFRKYFIFKRSRDGFLVGDGTVGNAAIGWVPKDHVRTWNTQQVLYFINKQAEDRQPVRIWRRREDVGKLDQPYFEENLNRGETSEPFPVLEKDGDFVKVAFLWDAEGAVKALDDQMLEGRGVDRSGKAREVTGGAKDYEETMQEMIAETKRMDVVLVMDVTQSMGEYMEQARQRLVAIVRSLNDLEVDGPRITTRIGVVAYRDYHDRRSTFQTKMLPLTEDHEQVLAFLGELEPAGGKYTNEAVSEALANGVESMDWGAHSSRVMVLVGDAPPHTPDDKDTTLLLEAGTKIQSAYFAQPFEENAARIRQIGKKNNIQLYALAVGEHPATRERFRKYVEDERFFFALKDSRQFIATLQQELERSHARQRQAVGRLEDVVESKDAGKLSQADLEYFKLINVNPEELAAIASEPILEGWCRLDMGQGEQAAAAVYMTRRQLESWELRLREQIKDLAGGDKSKEIDILRGLADVHAGPGAGDGTLGQVIKRAGDLPFKPGAASEAWLNQTQRAKAARLRRDLNRLTILLLTDGLFNKHEEGWIPIDLLPGTKL